MQSPPHTHPPPGGRLRMWLGLFAVVAALIVLLVCQYRWLADLQRTSQIAREAALQRHLKVVDKEIAYHYITTAERILNLPASVFTPEFFPKAPAYLAKTLSEVEGVKHAFLSSHQPETRGLYLFDPDGRSLREPELSTPEIVAVVAATAHWGVLAKKGSRLEAGTLTFEERDPRFPMILNPITDEEWRLVGVAGVVIDENHFRTVVLPRAITEARSLGPTDNDLAFTVRDGQGNLVIDDFSNLAPTNNSDDVHSEAEVRRLPGDGSRDKTERAQQRLSLVFKEWTVGVADRRSSPAQWARTNFLINLGLSAALALLLLGGIVLTLRTAAREMRLSRMKNDFVSNVSHELRTPVASIRVFGEFMRLGRVEDEAKVREYGEYIETESRRLTQLIDNILDFSRIESGRKVYEFVEADLDEVVEEAVRSFDVRLRQRGFRVDFQGSTTGQPKIHLDPSAIAQAVANLVDNAVKYSAGDRQISIRITRGRRQARIAVRDEGIGISREEQQRIFERFHRVSTGAVHDVRGSGLGLAIVQHIVQAHGGRVTVDSEPGAGSTFVIHLPLTAAAAAERAAQEHDAAPEVEVAG